MVDCAVANVSLECDSVEVGEDVGLLEVCAVLTFGDLAIPITVNLSTICDEACGRFIIIYVDWNFRVTMQ